MSTKKIIIVCCNICQLSFTSYNNKLEIRIFQFICLKAAKYNILPVLQEGLL
jgi:hypothetical protein